MSNIENDSLVIRPYFKVTNSPQVDISVVDNDRYVAAPNNPINGFDTSIQVIQSDH
jgi:hypothetical protein